MNRRTVLLVNPTITSARSARFPLAALHLAAAIRSTHDVRIIDGNVDRDFDRTLGQAVLEGDIAAVCISVMGGPQLVSAIAASRAVRAAAPGAPIVWGGYFPTICPDATLHAPYVDFAVRGQGEATLRKLVAVLAEGRGDSAALRHIDGLSWRDDGVVSHNAASGFSPEGTNVDLPYELLDDPQRYLGRTYLGQRTAGHQAALGCRYRCTFCGVATLFCGQTALPTADRLRADLRHLQSAYGADSIQFYDHNFFDREVDMEPLLNVLAELALPWWCYARADALVNLSSASWAQVRKSRLRMAYIGAETPSDSLLHDMRKGTRSDQTLAAVERCREHGVVPELSFMLAPPADPEGETERTFDFIRRIKRIHPATEVMLHVYTPHPTAGPPQGPRTRQPTPALRDRSGQAVAFPRSADEWAEPQWVRYWCHQDAPWLSDALRRRIQDFSTVLGCRFPTLTDIRTPAWQKSALKWLAAPRYHLRRYDGPWELNLSQRFVHLWDPRVSSL